MIIGVVGQKRSGKDTLAQYFINQAGFVPVKMADTLKSMLAVLYYGAGLDEELIQRKIEGDLKEEPCETLFGKTPRYAMQTIGTEWRDMIGRDLWLQIWTSKVQSLTELNYDVICTDIRFHHEANRIRELGGHLVRVDRADLPYRDQHISETEMMSIEVDHVFNNHLTIPFLHAQAHEYLTKCK